MSTDSPTPNWLMEGREPDLTSHTIVAEGEPATGEAAPSAREFTRTIHPDLDGAEVSNHIYWLAAVLFESMGEYATPRRFPGHGHHAAQRVAEFARAVWEGGGAPLPPASPPPAEVEAELADRIAALRLTLGLPDRCPEAAVVAEAERRLHRPAPSRAVGHLLDALAEAAPQAAHIVAALRAEVSRG